MTFYSFGRFGVKFRPKPNLCQFFSAVAETATEFRSDSITISQYFLLSITIMLALAVVRLVELQLL